MGDRCCYPLPCSERLQDGSGIRVCRSWDDEVRDCRRPDYGKYERHAAVYYVRQHPNEWNPGRWDLSNGMARRLCRLEFLSLNGGYFVSDFGDASTPDD